jgi:hypothetical protein
LDSNSLFFKKTIFLFDKLEKPDYLEDPIRLKFIAHQVIEETLQGKYELDYKEYLSFAGLFCFLEFGNYENFRRALSEKDFIEEILDKTNQILKRIYSRDLLRREARADHHVARLWEKISSGITAIMTTHLSNATLFLNNREKELNICHFMILNLIKHRELYGVQLFPCEPYQIPFLPNKLLYLGLRYDCLFILERNKKFKVLEKFLLEDLRETVIYPKSIKFVAGNRNYRFNGKSCFGIQEMIRRYTALREVISM